MLSFIAVDKEKSSLFNSIHSWVEQSLILNISPKKRQYSIGKRFMAEIGKYSDLLYIALFIFFALNFYCNSEVNSEHLV